MFRKLLVTTAVATLLAGGAIAQDSTTPAPADPAAPTTTAPAETTTPTDTTAAPVMKTDGQLAGNIIGETVYNGMGDDAENIGEVNDLLLDANGSIKSLIIGVGGFLGVGEKDVEVDYKTAEWTERNGDRWIVVASTKEQLDAQPTFDRTPYDPVAPAATGSTETAPAMPAPDATTTTPPAAAPAEEPQPAN